MKTITFNDAMSEETFSGLMASWGGISKYRESGSVYVYHKGIMLRRCEAIVHRPDIVKTYFNGIPPIVLDIEARNFEDNESIEAEFVKFEKENPSPIYWICGIDQYLVGKQNTFFHYLRKRQAENPSISYVLFFGVNFLHPSVSSVLIKTSTFLQNTYFTPLFDEHAGLYFFDYLTRKWDFHVSPSLKKEVLGQTSRHFLTLKQAARIIRDDTPTDFKMIKNHEMMRIRLKSIFDGFLPSEQTALSKIISGANDFDSDEIESITFLKKTGWLESRGHRLYLTIPLLSDYIESLSQPQNTFEIISEKILYGGIPVDTMFSAKERIIMRLLIEHKGQTVLRDTIAETLWGDAWEDEYSDWAIDQLMLRIRKKCVSLNLPKSILQVVKGKGYRYDKR